MYITTYNSKSTRLTIQYYSLQFNKSKKDNVVVIMATKIITTEPKIKYRIKPIMNAMFRFFNIF